MSNENGSRSVAGGSAAERGLDFQARVSAIVIAHVIAERPLGWLTGVLEDVPAELAAETGGPGDDIRFLTREAKCVELQAKRGLQRGPDLWEALMSLAKGIGAGFLHGAVLAVCPDSSGTIKGHLSEDIVRLGMGRSDGLRPIGRAFAEQLRAASLDPHSICDRLRVVVVSAINSNREAEATATERMGRVIESPDPVWDGVVAYGRELIRIRGRCTTDDISRKLTLWGVSFRDRNIETRIQLQATVQRWLQGIYTYIPVIGVRGKVPFEECWIPLEAQALAESLDVDDDLEGALRRYHTYANASRSVGLDFAAQAIGRFVHHCVVLGGPGIGKSTLLKKLALEYSRDGYLTLLVRLPQLATLMARGGRRFEDSLLDAALDGSGIRTMSTSLDGAVILCDGLDECGNEQPSVTAALHAFSHAHPRARIVISSRPIGYRPGAIGHWKHYELRPLRDEEAEKALPRIISALPFPSDLARERALARATEQLSTRGIKETVSRSPLMLTLLAALSAEGIDVGIGKAALYRQIFKLIETHPSARPLNGLPTEPERSRFLELLGWCLLAHGHESIERTLDRCVGWWSQETGQPRLASAVKVYGCRDYWEQLGVIEQVRTSKQEALTFVHKTFGEFAAARYISRCEDEERRTLVSRAIQTPAWKEALSFASHLGMASLILEVWAELANNGEQVAADALDDATELVVRSGVPIDAVAMDGFTACCWAAAGNAMSRSRYAAGEALCIASKEHWPSIRDGVFARLNDTNQWIKLVAWTCLSLSPETDISYRELLVMLDDANEHGREDISHGFPTHRPTDGPVRRHLLIGATRRILERGPDPEGLEILTLLLKREPDWLNVGTFWDVQKIFKEFGRTMPWDEKWSMSPRDFVVPGREQFNSATVYILDVLDDPSLLLDDEGVEEISRSWELAALMCASHYWVMPLSEIAHMSAAPDVTERRRRVMRGIARAAGIDSRRLIAQIRFHKRQIVDGLTEDTPLIFGLPRVDIETRFDASAVCPTTFDDLETVILGGGSFFPSNAAALLEGLRDRPEYAGAIARLLARATGESMRLSALLAGGLPDPVGQPLLLRRLAEGKITPDQRHLFAQLKPPFDERHVDLVRRALASNVVQAAKAAAQFSEQLPLTPDLVDELRAHFVQWISKEEPYPKGGGIVPDSPRDALANILARACSTDHRFLLELSRDDRQGVRAVGKRTLIQAASASSQLRGQIMRDTESAVLGPDVLRSLINEGVYIGEEAFEVLSLLRSDDARLRYAAVSILDVEYLTAEAVHAESFRLLSDPDLDIREAASQALRKLQSVSVAYRIPN